jgi:hypothetical protein
MQTLSSLAFLGPIGGPEIIILFFVLLPLVLTVISLISCLSATFADPTNKLIWVIVILFLPLLGPILYFCISPSQRRSGMLPPPIHSRRIEPSDHDHGV